ncbi:MAG: CpsB/CapC family capsule biosynthesis tyrosine phosphatase [Bacilli bacterium]
MIDLNNQILKLSYDEAEQEIAQLIRFGYKAIILTSPMLNEDVNDLDEIISKFNRLKVCFKQIKFFFGSEINFHYSMIHRLSQGDVLSLNQSEYVFVHLPNDKKPEQLNQLIQFWSDKKIILSCIDEYKYFSVNDLIDLKQKGVLFFANINNVHSAKLKKLLKKKLIDFLGTYQDVKDYRTASFFKKLDRAYFNEIVQDNYQKIIQIDL